MKRTNMLRAAALPSVLFFFGCQSLFMRNDQVLMNHSNPMPDPVSRGLPGVNMMVSRSQAPFRDASIHEGSRGDSSISHRPNQGQPAAQAQGIVMMSISSLPSSNMLYADLRDYDWKLHQLVPFYGDSMGCSTRLNLPVPIRGSEGRRFIMPVRFEFTAESFFESLREQMKANRVAALFDSRLDIEFTSVLFGIFQKRCYRFSAWGVQERNR